MPNQKIETRGEQRFASITYSLLAEWTGYALSTIQSYGAKGLIPKDDLGATLRWVNARRQRLGLPLIGVPGEDDPPDVPEPEVIIATPTDSGYNPLTGGYE